MANSEATLKKEIAIILEDSNCLSRFFHTLTHLDSLSDNMAVQIDLLI